MKFTKQMTVEVKDVDLKDFELTNNETVEKGQPYLYLDYCTGYYSISLNADRKIWNLDQQYTQVIALKKKEITFTDLSIGEDFRFISCNNEHLRGVKLKKIRYCTSTYYALRDDGTFNGVIGERDSKVERIK